MKYKINDSLKIDQEIIDGLIAGEIWASRCLIEGNSLNPNLLTEMSSDARPGLRAAAARYSQDADLLLTLLADSSENVRLAALESIHNWIEQGLPGIERFRNGLYVARRREGGALADACLVMLQPDLGGSDEYRLSKSEKKVFADMLSEDSTKRMEAAQILLDPALLSLLRYDSDSRVRLIVAERSKDVKDALILAKDRVIDVRLTVLNNVKLHSSAVLNILCEDVDTVIKSRAVLLRAKKMARVEVEGIKRKLRTLEIEYCFAKEELDRQLQALLLILN